MDDRRRMALDALIRIAVADLPALTCPEMLEPYRPCGRAVTTITEQDSGDVWTCAVCARAYIGDRRPINTTDRLLIAADNAEEHRRGRLREMDK